MYAPSERFHPIVSSRFKHSSEILRHYNTIGYKENRWPRCLLALGYSKKDFTVVRFYIHNMYVVQWDDHETISEVVTRLDFILSNIKKESIAQK